MFGTLDWGCFILTTNDKWDYQLSNFNHDDFTAMF